MTHEELTMLLAGLLIGLGLGWTWSNLALRRHIERSGYVLQFRPSRPGSPRGFWRVGVRGDPTYSRDRADVEPNPDIVYWIGPKG